MIDVRAIAVTRATRVREALAVLDRAASGILLLVDAGGRFERTITDGDLRRLLLEGHGLDATLQALPVMRSIVIDSAYSRRDALDLMNRHSINHLPVIDAAGHAVEVLERRAIDQQILLSVPHMGMAEREYVEEAFRSNWIAPLGPNVDAFERELAQAVGVGHAAALSSGTAAIHLALRLLGVGLGDRVFCSTLTFVASASPIVYQGAEPVFIDSEPHSWNMSAAALGRAFDAAVKAGRLPKAVVVVNLYGQSADLDPLRALCDRHGVPIVEDAAESLGARYKGRASGTGGRIGVFSFNGNKIITTSGGGMLVSDDAALVERARFLATQARDPAPHYQHSEIGYNYRMSNILAGVGRGQLKVLDERVRARREVFERYREGLADLSELAWMPEPEWSFSTRWLTACTLDPRSTRMSAQEFVARLGAELIEARPLWKPMHLQPLFAHCEYFSHGDASVSDRLFASGLCLPSGSNLSGAQQQRVIDTMRSILRGG